MKNVIIAATLATLGIASYSLPAFALADDYGQFAYTAQSQSASAPNGIAIDRRSFRASIDINTPALAAPKGTSNTNSADVFARTDREHLAW